MRKRRVLLAGLLAMSLGGAAGVASASPLLTLQIEGSTTGAPGTYSSRLRGFALPGQTIYYEVNAIFNDGATNSNTANSPDGVNDSIDSLPSFQLTAASGDVFPASGSGTLNGGNTQYGTMQNGFGVGSGAGVTQPNGANTAVIRAVNSPGVYLNADQPLTIETGQLTLGTFTFGELIEATYYGTSGLTKVAGTLTTITGATESSADPIISYTPLMQGMLPEPASLTLFGLGALGLLPRRRQSA